MITHIKENNPETQGKVLIGEIETPSGDLIEGEMPITDENALPQIKEIKVWKNKGVKCFIQETSDLI